MFFAFLILILIFYFYLKTKPAPSCFDGIQNQGELGIDCGGPCPPCRLFELKELKVENIKKFTFRNVLDVMVEILNLNPDYGLERIKITLKAVKDDLIVWQEEKIISLNPGQRKYIFFENLPLRYKDLNLVVDIEKPQLTDWQIPPILPSKVEFEFSTITMKEEENYIILEGEVFNKKNITLRNVNLIGFLQDSYGYVEVFSSTNLGGFKAFERKNFKLIFFKPKIKISDYKLIIDINLFDQNVPNF